MEAQRAVSPQLLQDSRLQTRAWVSLGPDTPSSVEGRMKGCMPGHQTELSRASEASDHLAQHPSLLTEGETEAQRWEVPTGPDRPQGLSLLAVPTAHPHQALPPQALPGPSRLAFDPGYRGPVHKGPGRPWVAHPPTSSLPSAWLEPPSSSLPTSRTCQERCPLRPFKR